MKKIFEGKFCDMYYNECEARSPIAIEINNSKETLCNVLKDAFEITHGWCDPRNNFFGKKVKITVEIEE